MSICSFRRRSSVVVHSPPLEQTSRLLSLPRELRDEILLYLLEERTEPPAIPPVAGRRQKLHDMHYPPYRFFRYPVWVWVCRQMRHECFEMVRKRSTGRTQTAELDILFRGYLSWPTWIYLTPILPRETPFDLNVSLRIFSTEAFRSSDGWPRQPGTAFRDLLWVLNNFFRNGPSLTSIGNSKGLYRINRLSVTVSFLDQYTPSTHPETAHNVFRMLKQLATVGLTSDLVRNVTAHTEYMLRGEKKTFDGSWDCPDECAKDKFQEWNAIGFFSPAQISG